MSLPNETLLTLLIGNLDRGPVLYNQTVTTLTTASALTLTAAQICGGQIKRDPNGASRIDTLPTAALLVAYLRNLCSQKGVNLPKTLAFDFIVQNDASGAYTITIQVGSGGTATGQTLTIAQNNSKCFSIHITETKKGSEAYFLYNRGTYTT